MRADELVSYLVGLGCTDVKAVQVKLGKETFLGAAYRQTVPTLEGSPAYMAGERSYTREMIYCLNSQPLPVQAKKLLCRVSYVRPDDDRGWFIAAFSPEIIPEDKREYYPFGPFFLLTPWTIPDTKVDTGLKRPYTLTYMEVTEL